jgi:hypothetical protein
MHSLSERVVCPFGKEDQAPPHVWSSNTWRGLCYTSKVPTAQSCNLQSSLHTNYQFVFPGD